MGTLSDAEHYYFNVRLVPSTRRAAQSVFRYAIRSARLFLGEDVLVGGHAFAARVDRGRTFSSVTGFPLVSLARLNSPLRPGPTFFSTLVALWQGAHCSKTALPLAASPRAFSLRRPQRMRPAPRIRPPQPFTQCRASPVYASNFRVRAARPNPNKYGHSYRRSPPGRQPRSRHRLQTDAGEPFRLSDLRGKTVVLYFYPKADTPGCTTEACEFRDSGRASTARRRDRGCVARPGRSRPSFKAKYDLPFTLLSDIEKTAAQAYGVWREKNMYGKKTMGIVRSTFLIGTDGNIRKIFANERAGRAK